MTTHRSSIQTDSFTWLSSWGVPAGLVILAGVPIVMGTSRLVDVANGEVIYAPYFPLIVHVVAVTVYCLAGALQFSKKLRRSRPRWHRITGRWVLPAGVVSAVSGLWLTQFYPNTPFDGTWVYASRLCGGTLMLGFLAIGLSALKNRNFRRHGRSMMRAYAIGIGAGTQVLFLFPIMEVLGYKQDFALALGITAGWVLNLAVAELSLRSAKAQQQAAVGRTG